MHPFVQAMGRGGERPARRWKRNVHRTYLARWAAGVIAALNRGRRPGRQRPSFFVDFLDAFGLPVPPKATADALVRQNNVGIPRSQGLGGRRRRLRCIVWSWTNTNIDLVVQQARKKVAVLIPLRFTFVRAMPREPARPAKAAS